MSEIVRRKLSAIFNADAVGYSRLMAEDELGTIRTLTFFRKLMCEMIVSYGGRVVDSPGDNLLADFGSAVDAVTCAVDIQKTLNEKVDNPPELLSMQFRIGINLGDIIYENDQIYGDGVNIAARIQELSSSGGVAVSESVFDQVKKQASFRFKSMGEHLLKNYPEPVKIYRVETAANSSAQVSPPPNKGRRPWLWVAVALGLILFASVTGLFLHQARWFAKTSSEVATPQSELRKPTLAVLPFVNMSDDKKQEYFCDGLTGNIIASLSKIPELFVIARNSVFAYKGKQVNIEEISRKLGVRYILEGSVQRSGNMVRVTSQLIDVDKNTGIWSERYDQHISDLFKIQDDITMKLITALQVKLTEGERALVTAQGTSNLEAYLKILEARGLLWRNDKNGNLQARKKIQEALQLDPNYPMAYRALADTHMNDTWFGWSPSTEESLLLAYVDTQKALELDPDLASARGLLGHLYTQMGQHEKAVKECQKAIAHVPNDADAYGWFGMALNFAGRPYEALKQIRKAIRLNPIPPSWYYQHLGTSYRLLQRFNEALESYRKALERSPTSLNGHLGLTATYVMAGHSNKGRAQAKKLKALHPDFVLEKTLKRWPYQNTEEKELVLASLREAGLE